MDSSRAFEIKWLRKKAKDPSFPDRALARIALACVTGRGVRLTAEEVAALYASDDALHTRLEWNPEHE